MSARMITLIAIIVSAVILAMLGAAIHGSTDVTSASLPVSDAVLDAITVSGTITGPSGPVEGVRVMVNSFVDVQEDTTDGSGNLTRHGVSIMLGLGKCALLGICPTGS
jgi:hypothetical protein